MTLLIADLPDVQSRRDKRGIPIDHVGISNLRYPITVLDAQRGRRNVTATLTLSVSLPADFKGTHMSRFVEVLHKHCGELTLHTLPELLNDLKRNLEAERARAEVRFPYFLERRAPVTGACAFLDYECWFEAEANHRDSEFVIGVRAPVTTVCPCSKEISAYGAHNQRGIVQMRVASKRLIDGMPEIIWIEELVAIAEESASAPVYPLLKRPDERHVTMQAYDNPVFVEDLARNVSERLLEDARVAWFEVHVTNNESIHNHDAFARIERRRS